MINVGLNVRIKGNVQRAFPAAVLPGLSGRLVLLGRRRPEEGGELILVQPDQAVRRRCARLRRRLGNGQVGLVQGAYSVPGAFRPRMHLVARSMPRRLSEEPLRVTSRQQHDSHTPADPLPRPFAFHGLFRKRHARGNTPASQPSPTPFICSTPCHRPRHRPLGRGPGNAQRHVQVLVVRLTPVPKVKG